MKQFFFWGTYDIITVNCEHVSILSYDIAVWRGWAVESKKNWKRFFEIPMTFLLGICKIHSLASVFISSRTKYVVANYSAIFFIQRVNCSVLICFYLRFVYVLLQFIRKSNRTLMQVTQLQLQLIQLVRTTTVRNTGLIIINMLKIL